MEKILSGKTQGKLFITNLTSQLWQASRQCFVTPYITYAVGNCSGEWGECQQF